MRQIGLAVLGASLLVAVMPTATNAASTDRAYGSQAVTAGAGGGTSISNAPTVPIGQQQFGNTTTGEVSGEFNECSGFSTDTTLSAEYWKLALTAGDSVTINWEAPPHTGDKVQFMGVFGAGVDDFSINNAHPYKCFQIGNNGHAQSVFTVNNDGVYPLIFSGTLWGGTAPGGPYDFTVSVTHWVVLAVPRLGSLPQRASRLQVGLHLPDGKPIDDPNLVLSVRGFWLNLWHVIASGSATNGTASLTLTFPASLRGRVIRLRVDAAGSGYRATHSPILTVAIRK